MEERPSNFRFYRKELIMTLKELVLGHAPVLALVDPNESCPGGSRARAMSMLLREQLIHHVGPPPSGVELVVRPYHTPNTNTVVLVCIFDADTLAARRYAAKIDRARISDWDPPSQQLLQAS
jgi:hypothetical protein